MIMKILIKCTLKYSKVKYFTKLTLVTLVPWLASLAGARFYVTVPTMRVRTGNGAVRTVKTRTGTTLK
mgnify:CR=1 FL=1